MATKGSRTLPSETREAGRNPRPPTLAARVTSPQAKTGPFCYEPKARRSDLVLFGALPLPLTVPRLLTIDFVAYRPVFVVFVVRTVFTRLDVLKAERPDFLAI